MPIDDSKPLVSICIPTYNREKQLSVCIDHIVRTDEFEDGILQIVIADNCSDDGTQEYCEKLVSKNKNIIYIRNSNNVRDRNYPIVMSVGAGIYRKLIKDTYVVTPQYISQLCRLTKEYAETRPTFVFISTDNAPFVYSNLNEALRRISYWCTDIASFGAWENDMEAILALEDECKSSLWQVPSFIACARRSKTVVVADTCGCETQEVQKKDLSYGLFDVFYTNYLGFMKNALDAGDITQDCFEYLERDLLFGFFLPWCVTTELQGSRYDLGNHPRLFDQVVNAYAGKPYLARFKADYRKKLMIGRIKGFVKLAAGR